MYFSTRNRGFSPRSSLEPALRSPSWWSPRLAQGPWHEDLVPAPWWELCTSSLTLERLWSQWDPLPQLAPLPLSRQYLPILVSQLSWNSRGGNFISVAEFENNSSDAVQIVNGLYRHRVGPGFLLPPGVQLPPAALPLWFALVSADTVLCSTCEHAGDQEGFSGGRTG